MVSSRLSEWTSSDLKNDIYGRFPQQDKTSLSESWPRVATDCKFKYCGIEMKVEQVCIIGYNIQLNSIVLQPRFSLRLFFNKFLNEDYNFSVIGVKLFMGSCSTAALLGNIVQTPESIGHRSTRWCFQKENPPGVERRFEAIAISR